MNKISTADFWLDNLRFTNDVVLKNQVKDIFLPFAKSNLSTDETKYLVKRFFRKLNVEQNKNRFLKFLNHEKVVNYSRYEYDYDSWCEWMILKFDSIEKAAKFVHSYDPDWVGEIDFQLREYDCTGETFSSGMKFTKISDNLVFAYKRYDLDV